MSALVLVGCGKDKRPGPSPAGKLYTGQYHRACLATALALVDRERVLILSAKHGLLSLGELVWPYELTLGQPGAISAVELAAQAALRGELDSDVTVLASSRYVNLARQIWPDLNAPLAGLGIGYQRQKLRTMRGLGSPLSGVARGR